MGRPKGSKDSRPHRPHAQLYQHAKNVGLLDDLKAHSKGGKLPSKDVAERLAAAGWEWTEDAETGLVEFTAGPGLVHVELDAGLPDKDERVDLSTVESRRQELEHVAWCAKNSNRWTASMLAVRLKAVEIAAKLAVDDDDEGGTTVGHQIIDTPEAAEAYIAEQEARQDG